MNATYNKVITAATALTLGLVMAAAALAGPPYDAGFKARGMKERDVSPRGTRMYAAPQWSMQQQPHRVFSYEPQANPATAAPTANADCGQRQAASRTPVAQPQVRRFSYEPAVQAPVYRDYGRTYRMNGRGNGTGYGGAYRSKALLY